MAASDTPTTPLLVRPRIARQMLGNIGLERLYDLLNSCELESFKDGRARYITIASIEAYIRRRLAQAGGAPSSSPAWPPPRRHSSDAGAERARQAPDPSATTARKRAQRPIPATTPAGT